MPSYDGVNLFGVAVSMRTVDNPRAAQENSYPGLSGVESLDQGLRGRFTIVEGTLVAPDPYTLGASEAFVRSYNDGIARDLVDNFGNLWPAVLLESFEPQGRVKQSSGSGFALRPYTARFKHLL